MAIGGPQETRGDALATCGQIRTLSGSDVRPVCELCNRAVPDRLCAIFGFSRARSSLARFSVYNSVPANLASVDAHWIG